MSEKAISEKHFNGLRPGEHERLAVLSEELGEAIQAIGKILRHGYEGSYADGTTNRKQLAIELADVSWAIDELFSRGEVPGNDFRIRAQQRLVRNNFLHHEQE